MVIKMKEEDLEQDVQLEEEDQYGWIGANGGS